MEARSYLNIPIEELKQQHVWEIEMDDEINKDGSFMTPVSNLPVNSLENRLVFLDVCLANGLKVAGLLGNVCLNDVEANEEFLSLSVESNGEWYHLDKYFGVMYNSTGPRGGGPAGLCQFLGLEANEVFPISYDISDIAVGPVEITEGMIPMEPKRRITQRERASLFRRSWRK
jgi:hypothetical protein